MARIDLLTDQPADPLVQEMFAEVRARGIAVPNLYRMLGNAPAMLRAWLDFAWPLRLEAKTPRAIRELLILRGAQVSGARYEWVHHVPMALAAGVSQAKVDALEAWQQSPLYDDAERAVLRIAEEVTGGPGASAEAIAQLKDHFDPAAIVELVLTASFYVCVGRVLLSMDIELEQGVQ
ncbi:MAG: carboxymuconolactone decarboxylase family protein [Quisquiliibacterium sp.]